METSWVETVCQFQLHLRCPNVNGSEQAAQHRASLGHSSMWVFVECKPNVPHLHAHPLLLSPFLGWLQSPWA